MLLLILFINSSYLNLNPFKSCNIFRTVFWSLVLYTLRSIPEHYWSYYFILRRWLEKILDESNLLNEIMFYIQIEKINCVLCAVFHFLHLSYISFSYSFAYADCLIRLIICSQNLLECAFLDCNLFLTTKWSAIIFIIYHNAAKNFWFCKNK